MAAETDAAVVAATASIAVATLSLAGSWWTQRKGNKAALIQAQLARDLEALKGRLSQEHDAEKARRDYEYEARKRLYAELYPLAFQLNEAALTAGNRIQNLARAARTGHLGVGTSSWLDDSADPYYFNSTLYSLLAPLAWHELMSRRLTLFDLNLDPHLQRQRFFAKKAYQCLRSDFDFADPGRYAPLVLDPAQSNRKYEPRDRVGGASPLEERWLWRQGVYSGRVSQAVDALLTSEGTDPKGNRRERVMSYAEFANLLGSEDLRADRASSSMSQALHGFSTVVRGFHPFRRPVTWRIMLAQVACYRMILMLPSAGATVKSIVPQAELAITTEQGKFSPLPVDAGSPLDLGMSLEARRSEAAAAFDAANAYLRESAEEFIRDYPVSVVGQV